MNTQLKNIKDKIVNIMGAYKQLPRIKDEILTQKDRIEQLNKQISEHERNEKELKKAAEEWKDKREKESNVEVEKWKSKFDSMWSAWNKLAIETKGAEEAEKMAEELKKGQG